MMKGNGSKRERNRNKSMGQASCPQHEEKLLLVCRHVAGREADREESDHNFSSLSLSTAVSSQLQCS